MNVECMRMLLLVRNDTSEVRICKSFLKQSQDLPSGSGSHSARSSSLIKLPISVGLRPPYPLYYRMRIKKEVSDSSLSDVLDLQRKQL